MYVFAYFPALNQAFVTVFTFSTLRLANDEKTFCDITGSLHFVSSTALLANFICCLEKKNTRNANLDFYLWKAKRHSVIDFSPF